MSFEFTPSCIYDSDLAKDAHSSFYCDEEKKLARIQPRTPAPFLLLGREARRKGGNETTNAVAGCDPQWTSGPEPVDDQTPVRPSSLGPHLSSPPVSFPPLPSSPFSPVAGESSGGGAVRRAFLPGKQGDLWRALLPFSKVRSEDGLLFLFLFPQPPSSCFCFSHLLHLLFLALL